METINQFNWPEVAAIAGAAIVCLMTLIGILLAVILRRQGEHGKNGNGVIAQVKEIQGSIEIKIDSIEDKIDQEIVDRKEDLDMMRHYVEQGRTDQRRDINVLHKKFEVGLAKVVDDFRIMCSSNQERCGALQRAQIKGTKEKLALNCRAVDRIDKDRQRKWEHQEELNMGFTAKLTHTVYE
jgi:hypothetical protein